MTKFKKMYDEPVEIITDTQGDCLTQQQFKDEVDIYNVLRKHTHGLQSNVNTKTAIYASVS